MNKKMKIMLASAILLIFITVLLLNFPAEPDSKPQRVCKGWEVTLQKEGVESWVSEPFYVKDYFRGKFEWLTINLHSVAHCWIYETQEENPLLVKREVWHCPPPVYIEREGLWYGDTFGVTWHGSNKFSITAAGYVVRVSVPISLKIEWKVIVEQIIYEEVS